MTNQKKRIIPAAALVLSLALQGPASYGTVEVESQGEIAFPKIEGSHQVETELKGTIEVALISATLPGDVEFRVNPSREFSLSTPGNQMDNPEPDKFTVTNHSNVPVRLEISRVEAVRPEDITFTTTDPYAQNGPAQTFQLVDQIAEVNTYGTALLVLGEADTIYTSEKEFEQYAICPGKTNIPVAENIAANSHAKLQIYGKVMADFYGEYQFTIRPTLKISTVRSQ